MRYSEIEALMTAAGEGRFRLVYNGRWVTLIEPRDKRAVEGQAGWYDLWNRGVPQELFLVDYADVQVEVPEDQ